MPNVVTATVAVTLTPLPAGSAAYDHTTLTLTDSAGAVQTASVNGSESPPWVAVFNNVAAGSGSVSAQAADASNTPIGTSVSTSFVAVGPATFPQPVSITAVPS